MFLISNSKGSPKNTAIARLGFTQNYEKFEIVKEIGKKPDQNTDSAEEYSVPRPVFQTSKKTASQRHEYEEETLSPQHQEIVKYINDSWNMILAQNPYDNPSSPDRNSRSSVLSSNSSLTSFYCVEPPSPVLSDFKPFDLESWWGRRLYNNITKSL